MKLAAWQRDCLKVSDVEEYFSAYFVYIVTLFHIWSYSKFQFKLIYPSIKLLAPRKFMKSIGLRVVGECRQFHFSSALIKEGSFMF